MITLRCTGRVRKRFKLTVVDTDEVPTARLGDWYANLLNVGSQRWVMCVSERSLLPVLVPAKNSEFPHRLSVYVYEALRGIGVTESVAASEADECRDWRVAKTQSRSILGSMNDFSLHFKYVLASGASLDEAVRHVTEMPCGMLDWRYPSEAARELLRS